MVFYQGIFNAVHPAWRPFLEQEAEKEYFRTLMENLEQALKESVIYPPKDLWFNAFSFFPPQACKAIILGQDPYHGPGQAHGLAFSVPMGQKFPPSLRNIFKEYQDDLGLPIPFSGDLSAWAREGVLLLNTSLTVEASNAGAHLNWPWGQFSDAVIQYLSELCSNLVFILWGKPAQSKKKLIASDKHHIIESAHPSPLSAYRGFFGSKPFSRSNDYLLNHGSKPIAWNLD